ncbi:helix-turn-helix domain-containing protein [Paraburkholderia kururiensis]|uniref:Helix-turn-helix domain-containing protein n=1 Tax=Paraburkholderia kururiensis TaxID=984307 RepID=A0ABZ0WDT2_9BURK|nr:helix-turn-helix domain-containing protein [Paraburkholderia kururiensis]WQD75487.1 helix-turn-helix domain-containing protein [Paraburkholderia kururiensis]
MLEKETRRNFDELSERRRVAMTLLEEGVSQADVARELAVSRQTVSRWAKLREEYPDEEAWRRRPLGRPGGLSEEKKNVLARMLINSYILEYGTEYAAPWTLARVARMIAAEFGVSYSLVQVRNILAGLAGGGRLPLRSRYFWMRLILRTYPILSGQNLFAPGKTQTLRDVVLSLGDGDFPQS